MADPAAVDLLIVGAGPTGLTAAIDAARHGLSFRIVDQKPHRSTFSKALVIHARTLEVLEVQGLAGAILGAGARFVALNLATGPGQAPVRVDLLEREWGDTRYPFWLSIPQYETERLMEERLAALGGQVGWSTRLAGLADRGDHVAATLEAPGGEETVRARWVLGCDGGRSATRELAGISLSRADGGATFALCDAHTSCDLKEDEGHAFLAEEGLLIVVPMPERGLFRLIAHVEEGTDQGAVEDPRWWDRLLLERAGVEYGAHDLAWSSLFRLHQGVADRYRAGRLFLLGDAAHIHSPVGGQGMNTGIQDAHNLVWKLALSERSGGEAAAYLDSYEAERRPTAVAMVGGTARATRAITGRHRALRLMAGGAARLALRSEAVQDRLGRSVGMLDLAYEGSPVAAEAVPGRPVRPGQRLPNPALEDGRRLHDLLDGLRHTVLAFPGDEDGGWDAWPDPGRKIVVGSAQLPDADGSIQAALGGRPGERLLVRPDRVVAALGRPAELLATLPRTLGVGPSTL